MVTQHQRGSSFYSDLFETFKITLPIVMCTFKKNLLITHLVLLPQLLHISLLAADLPLSLSVVLLGSVYLQTLLRVALRQSGQLSL